MKINLKIFFDKNLSYFYFKRSDTIENIEKRKKKELKEEMAAREQHKMPL